MRVDVENVDLFSFELLDRLVSVLEKGLQASTCYLGISNNPSDFVLMTKGLPAPTSLT